MYRLKQFQALKLSIEEAWDFFSDPKNLSEITPSSLGFTILSELPEKMYEGLFIQYKVSPLLNIPTTWVTEITRAKEPVYFVDEQRKGPYKTWHHEHFFKELKGGIMMYDVVHYDLPFGLLGKLSHPLIVKSKLDEIFGYRKKILREKFGEIEIKKQPPVSDFQAMIS